ncbi:MAG: GntR family transcriptional regulator [Rhodospirillaceae bacterium]
MTAVSAVGRMGQALSPVDQAYRYILDGILDGTLAPGMRIPTERVAETLGISRMPVRDALRRLEGDGAVVILANRGASIAAYTREQVVELMEMRGVLEALAARLALAGIGAGELDELDHLKRRMERSADDLGRWMQHHDDFHNYLSSLAHKPLLLLQTERMRLMLRPYFRRYYAESRELEIIGLEHGAIIDAIREDDPEHLERTVRAHAVANVAKVAAFA